MGCNFCRRRNIFLLLLVFFFSGATLYASVDKVSVALSQLCNGLTSLLPPVAMLMVLVAAAVYASGQLLGAETRARANTWAATALVGATIGMIFSSASPLILQTVYGSNVSCSGSEDQFGSLAISTSTLPGATEGQPYSAQLQAGGGQPPYEWSNTNVLFGSLGPISVQADGGIYSSQLLVSPGTYSFTAEVSDSIGQRASRQITVNVVANTGLVFINPPDQDWFTEGQSGGRNIQIQSGTAPIAYSYTGTLPAGIAYSPYYDSYWFHGIPQAGSAGTYVLQIYASDSAGRGGTKRYTMNVRSAPPLSITGSLQFKVGQRASQIINAQGGFQPYVWSVSPLPAGFTHGVWNPLDFNNYWIDSLSGPTAAGTFPIAVQVTDAHGTSVSQSFNIVVSP